MEQEVTVPDGVAGGDSVQFVGPNGVWLEATVPEGLEPGMTFLATVASACDAEESKPDLQDGLNAHLGSEARSDDVMLEFVMWCEREGIEDSFESFISDNAHRIDPAAADGGEQSLAAYELYKEYQALFDGAMQRAPHFRSTRTRPALLRAYSSNRIILSASVHALAGSLILFALCCTGFLCEAGVTADEFMRAASAADGLNDICLRIFIAQSEYDT
jgi:hypothetical protein